MLISTKEETKQVLNKIYGYYCDNKINNGDYDLESESVAYGDTYVSSGSYLSEKDEAEILKSFIEDIKNNEGSIADEILNDYLGEDITDENRAELLKVAKEGF